MKFFKILFVFGVYVIGLYLGDYICSYQWRMRVFSETDKVARPLEGTSLCPNVNATYCGLYKQLSIKYGELVLQTTDTGLPIHIPMRHGYVVTLHAADVINGNIGKIGISNKNVRGEPFLLEIVSSKSTQTYDAIRLVKNNKGRLLVSEQAFNPINGFDKNDP